MGRLIYKQLMKVLQCFSLFYHSVKPTNVRGPCTLVLYTLTSVCIFSILFSKHFLRCQHGEFVLQSRSCLVGDQLLYSPDLRTRLYIHMLCRSEDVVPFELLAKILTFFSATFYHKSPLRHLKLFHYNCNNSLEKLHPGILGL